MKDHVKLCPKGNYGEIVSQLKKVKVSVTIRLKVFFIQIVEKDANINVAAGAAKCLAHIAKGLRTKLVFLETYQEFFSYGFRFIEIYTGFLFM